MSIRIAVALVLLSAPLVSFAACEVNEKGMPSISGKWTCTTFCPGGETEDTVDYITQDGKQLQIFGGTNVSSTPSPATLNGSTFTVTGTTLTGRIANNCQEIIWSNSTIWIRK